MKEIEKQIERLWGMIVIGYAVIALCLLLIACNYMTDNGYKANNIEQRELWENFKKSMSEDMGAIQDKVEKINWMDSRLDDHGNQLDALLDYFKLQITYSEDRRNARIILIPREKRKR